ncbi:MAG: DUF4340 domain-containing protein [Oscillospiraceae bacterium]|jgi:hypothetical protein|nr:DUF4340 domain-containing protein [Oscillospiraceae bacterium]
MRIYKASAALTLAGIAAVLLVVYVILRGNAGFAASNRTAAVWDLSADLIERITIDNGSELLEFAHSADSGWTLTAPPGVPFSREIADALPLALVGLTAEKEIAANLNSSAEYGLDEPTVIQVFLWNRKEYRLLLGAETSSQTARYFSVDGRVYTMSAQSADVLMLNSLNVRDRNVLGFNRTLRPSDIAARITDTRVNGESRSEFTDALSKVNAVEFLGSVDFAVKYTIEFNYDGEPKVLYIGESAGDYFYAKTPDNTVIFTVSRRGFEDL